MRQSLKALFIFIIGIGALVARPQVAIHTNYGIIEVELYNKKAPVSTANFLKYARNGFYNGTVFHRVIRNFMIQGGGFDKQYRQKRTMAPIKNEADNGLKNNRGTLAMARTGVVHSATSQFFINVVDNQFLNYKNSSPQGYGYAVFGRVTKGMSIVDKIRRVQTGVCAGRLPNCPKKPVVILKTRVIKNR